LTSGGTTTLALKFTANTGLTFGSQILIDSSATRAEMDPAIVGLSSGNVAIAFESFQNAAPNNRDVRLQIYTPAGASVASVVVSDFDKNSAFPDVTELDNGDIVVTWQQTGGIAFRRYHGNGTPIDGAPVLIPGTSASLLPEITHLNDGGFLIAWGQLDGTESDLSGEYDSYLQRYDANGNAVGTTVHMDKPGDQYGGSLATLEDGRVVFSYTSETGDSTNVNTVNYQIFDPREHSISGTDGVDNIVGREDGSVIHGLKGNDKLQGRADHDVLYGEGGSDDMFGAAGNDSLVGAVGNDTLKGGSGKDLIYGGFGADSLRGGLGHDVFLYKAATDSTANPAGMDTIFDFHRFQDKISLKNVDANQNTPGRQAFDFIGDDNFHHHAGELRIEHTGGDTFVFADRNGDGTEDFAIHLTGTINLKEIDFAL
jgi:Ca2+-binding RTX toxin-like protein